MITKFATRSILSIAILCCISIFLIGCSGSSNGGAETIKDDELKSFMLGGIYFVQGYGGKKETDEYVAQYGTSPEELHKAYTEIFILPFKRDDGAGAKRTLENDWSVNGKEDLIKLIGDLKGHTLESSFTKSWDYARIVNVVCLGYCASHLTEAEAKQILKDLLPIAQKDYKTWNEYFADFATGRDKWDTALSADKTAFNTLSVTITQGDHNIYQLIPLN